MHRVILKAPKGSLCDHINGNGLDNRRKNLRFCTKSENAINSKIRIDNKTGYRGISWDKDRSKWSVRSRVNGKYIFLGRFLNKENAQKKYYNFTKKTGRAFKKP